PSELPIFLKPDGTSFTFLSEPVVGMGRTGILLRYGDRVLKIPKIRATATVPRERRYNTECFNDMSRDSFNTEKQIYERLGTYKGIIKCFKASDEGIELAFAEQGDLHKFITKKPEPTQSLKAKWTLS